MQKQNKTILILVILALVVAVGGFELFVRQGYVLVKRSDIGKSVTTTVSQPAQDAQKHTASTTDSVDTGTSTQTIVPKQPLENDTKSSLYIDAKTPDDRVAIDSAVLEMGGFIVVYENTPEPTGEILGTSNYLPAGEYADIPIIFSRDVLDGEEFDVMLHKDDGDRVFSLLTDEPLRGKSGNSVHARLIIESVTR